MYPLEYYKEWGPWSPDAGRYRSGYKQAKPYNLMCPMENFYSYSSENSTDTGGRLVDVRATFEPYAEYAGDSQLFVKTSNQAYKRLVDQLGDASSLGATLTAERRETWGMVVNIVGRALSAARNVRKLRLAEAARDLGLPYRERVVKKRRSVRQPNGRRRIITTRQTRIVFPNGREAAKNVASGWLLFSYGIAPLMGDIKASMDTLNSDFPFHRIRGAARMKTSRVVDSSEWYKLDRHLYELEVSVSQGVDVRVKNPNTFLAGRLGLVNPAQWALEAIPLSFVVDWFSNLSDVVSSMTDFVGLETSRPCVNTVETRHQNKHINVYGSWYGHADWHQVWKRRELSLVPPRLVFAYERFQWQRGLNAISLLIGALPRRK